MHIGTAGWSLPKALAASFPGTGSRLQRYARVFNSVEINSSFYRSHAVATYARWAEATPADFRFAVKLPRAITHEARLRDIQPALLRFLEETSGLGPKLGVLLVQLPPSLAWDPPTAHEFFACLASASPAALVCEPRHESWFTPAADQALAALRVTRAAADPARPPGAARPGGWLGADGDGRGALVYWRWHGSPRMYWSSYASDWLAARAADIARWPPGTDHWCLFDNTAGGDAAANALELQSLARRTSHAER